MTKAEYDLKFLHRLHVTDSDIASLSQFGWPPEDVAKELKEMLDSGLCSESEVFSDFMGARYYDRTNTEVIPEKHTGTDDSPSVSTVQPRIAKRASEFGDVTKRFLWWPYLPIGEFTVVMADGGTGKGFLCCGIAAAISSGSALPGDTASRTPAPVLLISSEDDGEDFKDRLSKSGANLDLCLILDRSDSLGMSIADRYEEFAVTVEQYHPALVVLDPWHAFLGADIDMARANAIRPILQKLSLLAKNADTAIVAISHVNKRSQGENANHAATGSTDFINAARSAVRVIFDDQDETLSRRIMVHTKANFAPYGKSVAFIIDGEDGLIWDGFSDVTKTTLEEAARNRKSPGEMLEEKRSKTFASEHLITVLMEAAKNTAQAGIRFTYDEFKVRFGEDIFGSTQPKRALDSIIPAMSERGYELLTGLKIKQGSTTKNGFFIQKVTTPPP